MTTTDSNLVAILDNGDQIHMFCNGGDDSTENHVYVRDISGVNTKDLGDYAPGRRLRVLKVHCSIGSVLEDIKIYGSDGRILLDLDSDVELSGIFENYNAVIRGLDIPLQKGVYVAINTGD